MKVKIKIKTVEFKELVSVAKHYASKKYFYKRKIHYSFAYKGQTVITYNNDCVYSNI